MDVHELSLCKYEADLMSSTIVFENAGVWASFVTLGHLYTIEEAKALFAANNVFPGSGTLGKWEESVMHTCSNKSDARTVTREYIAYNPVTTEYQWFCETLEISGTHGVGTVRFIDDHSRIPESEINSRGRLSTTADADKPGSAIKKITSQVGLKYALISLIAGITILCGMVYMIVLYQNSLKTLMTGESYTYLHEISSQLTSEVETLMENTHSKVNTLDRIMSRMEWSSTDELLAWLDDIYPIQSFSGLYLIDESGAWISSDQNTLQVFMPEFSVDVARRREMRISPAQNISGTDYLALGVPIDLKVNGGKRYTGLVAVISQQALQNQLDLSAFEGVGYAHIVTSDGRIILRSENENSSFDGYSLFSNMARATHLEPYTVDDLREGMIKGETLQCSFTVDGVEKISTFTPVGVADWYLISLLPSDFLNEKSNSFLQLTTIGCIIIGLAFMFLIMLIMVVQENGHRRLLNAAYVDPVTGGNTSARFEMLAKPAIYSPKEKFALLYVNIVDFKTYNDRFGHDEADKILRFVYETISSDLRDNECIGRLMADHFGVIIRADHAEDILPRIKRWDSIVASYGHANEEPYTVSMSYGIYFIDQTNVEFSQMLDNANLARKTVQFDHSKTLYAIYDKTLKNKLVYEKELADRVEYALAHGEFEMYLQPKYSLNPTGIAGAEALVRWRHPHRGLIMPGDFIPLFERTGHIRKLDLYMFRRACEWIEEIQNSGLTPIPVSVNLSRGHFTRDGFLDEFEAIYREFSFPASLIELEFTEGMLYDQMDNFHFVIERIHDIGFMCSMDDFGSGYSSLNMLSHLPLDAIKLDRQFFINTFEENSQEAITIEHIIDLIKSLNMQVVAEGVEQHEQVEILRQYGCDLVQGYVFSKPITARDLRDQIAGNTVA